MNELLGKDSWFAKWIAGELSLANGLVFVNNSFLLARIHEFAVLGESTEDISARLQQVEAYDAASRRHAHAMKTAIDRALWQAQAKLELMATGPASHGEKLRQNQCVRFYQDLSSVLQLQSTWAHTTFLTADAARKIMSSPYALRHLDDRKAFWKTRFREDIFASWFSSFKGIVDLRAAWDDRRVLRGVYRSRMMAAADDITGLVIGQQQTVHRPQIAASQYSIRAAIYLPSRQGIVNANFRQFEQNCLADQEIGGYEIVPVITLRGKKRARNSTEIYCGGRGFLLPDSDDET